MENNSQNQRPIMMIGESTFEVLDNKFITDYPLGTNITPAMMILSIREGRIRILQLSDKFGEEI